MNKKVTKSNKDNTEDNLADSADNAADNTANAASSAADKPANKQDITDIIQVQEFSLFEFCQRIQELIQQGYSFDFNNNDRFPMSYGSLITAGLVKKTR